MIFFGARLKKLRLDNRLRQDQFARLVGVERSTVSLWENDLRQPAYQTLVRIAEVFGVSTDYLLGRANSALLDLSGLTAAESALISQIVANMTEKNKKLEEFQS